MSNLFIYQSSAGSGKTYKLAKEYLKLAFKYPGAFKSILAITFTNKATEEMKSRVLKFLSELSLDNDKELKEQLIEEGVKGDIKELAKITLQNILHNYSDYSISTIDSFFNKVLRSFSKELRLQVGYKIELDQSEVLKKITEMLLMDIGKDDELRKYIEDFVLLKINDDKGWDIERDIMKLGEEIFKERYWEKKFYAEEQGGNKEISDSRKKIKVLISDISNIINNFEEYLKKIGDDAEKVMKQNGLEADDFSNKENGVIGFLLNKIRYKKEYDLENSKRAVGVYNDNTGWYTKTSKKKNEIDKAVNEGLYELLKSAIEFIQTEFAKYNSAKELKNTLYTLGIFEDLIEKLNEYRKSNRLLLQSDVNNILRGLISTDNSPFIYEKIGSNYKHLLIDEFQDTSTFQWKNLLPLIINVISEKNIAIVAGDVKQSIYRWRSGNMKLLLSEIYEDLEEFKELLKTEYLKTNRRSCQEIVEFNNEFFQIAAFKISEDIENENYKNLLQSAYSSDSVTQDFKKPGGYVHISFFEEEAEELTANEKTDKRVLEIIKEILEDGFELSDVLILVRRNAEARQISALLTGKGYNIISSDSLLLNNSPKVRLVVDLIKYITDNNIELIKADALYNYAEFILKEKVEYSKIFGDSYNEFLKKMPEGFFKENEMPKIKPVLNDLTAYELVENLIQIFRFDKISDPYLIKFQNAILEFTDRENSDLISFINWWEENNEKYSIETPENTNAVKIMTIHKAKGLQGRIVILPYANWKTNIEGNKDLIWVSSDEEPFNKSAAYPLKAVQNLNKTFFKDDYGYESAQTKLDNLNLLYVSFTRAEERLYAIVPDIKSKGRIGLLINNVVKNLEGFGENIFTKGKKVNAKNIKKENGVYTEKLENNISSDWYKKVIIKPKHKKIKELINKDFTFKTNWGILIHQVLSYMKTSGDKDAAVAKILSEGMITEEQKEKIYNHLEKILNNTDIRMWFSPENKVKAETDILLPDGRLLRPDRVIIKDKEAIVIDYKTGIEKEEHKRQLIKYAETLIQMGYSTVSKFLLYISNDDDVKVKVVGVE